MDRRDFIRLSCAAAGGLLVPSLASTDDVGAPVPAPPAAAGGPFHLPPLPWAKDALVPFISEETIVFHYGKHHQGYVNFLNTTLAGKAEANLPLEDIITSSDGAVFNNAAQHWNHSFYWKSLIPGGGGRPTGDLAAAIEKDFGSFAQFRTRFAAEATTQFGSGWAWLVFDQGKLMVTKTGNADLPLKHAQTALLTIDVWEHAYYIDYRNARTKYVEAVLDHLLDWNFAAANYAKAVKG